MPILPAEPDIYPPDLWERDGPPKPLARWWCLHTKPRQEKATARQLYTRRVGYYLPQVIRESRTPGGRKIRSILPLFSCYVFMHGNEQERLEALRGDTLANILEVGDQTALHHDLFQVYQMLASGLPVVLEPTYPVGDRVRIISGPLAGIVGIVVRRGIRDRFVALVDFLGCGSMVDLQDWQVERLDSDSSHSQIVSE